MLPLLEELPPLCQLLHGNSFLALASQPGTDTAQCIIEKLVGAADACSAAILTLLEERPLLQVRLK